jgi:hypothetical protein
MGGKYISSPGTCMFTEYGLQESMYHTLAFSLFPWLSLLY